jgi:glutamate synthase domain-containing protein 3
MADKQIFTSREINQALARQLEVTKTVQLTGLKGQHCIAVGMPTGTVIQVAGNAGDFFGALNAGGSLTLNGNTGRFCGDSMLSGEIVVNGDAGYGVGQYLRGGTVAVKGDCKGPVGQLMMAGTVLIDGAAGREVGKYLMGGDIVVAGDAGERAGENMMSGVIFLRGEPRSLGLNARMSKVTATDIERLKFLHKQYRFRGITDEEMFSEFQKVTAEHARPLTGEAVR